MTHDELDMEPEEEGTEVSIDEINKLMKDNASLRDRIMAKARARKTNPFTPSPWFQAVPEHIGLELVGTVTRYFGFQSRYGHVDAVTLTLLQPVTLKDGDINAGETLNVMLTGAMAYNFKESNPALGDVVLIEYVGQSQIREGETAHSWNYSHVPQSELTE